MSEEITFEHIRAAAEWALTAKDKPMPIDGHVRLYVQSEWDCKTACCIWGAAHILARGCPTLYGPNCEFVNKKEVYWNRQSLGHHRISELLFRPTTTPQQVLSLLDELEGNK